MSRTARVVDGCGRNAADVAVVVEASGEEELIEEP